MQSSLSAGDGQWCWHSCRHSKSNLKAWTVRHKAGNDKPNDHKTITVSLPIPPKQTNGKISGNIYSIWNSPGNHTRVFYFFWEAKQQGLETQTEETIVHSAMRGHNAVQLPSSMAFHNASTAHVLEAGRILKLFPRVDRRIQGSGLTQRLWPKVPQEVWDCHASTQSCSVVTGELLARYKAPWLNCGLSRLISISGIVL